ncbi:MAG: hypothetical protein HND44_21425 [Chloroflexi bacterium]|nr:hypothetical protein [Ardenticatenaceae bacterium]MBL1131004.1 hypothetical protein [Chloroflexota bacterium]NOG37102.1 hypothetical protein [Chloroflexota bacterium]GIK58766.1 MAG: hypothetical protein BroJett015_44290 [Chloroflexota bacterium]
MSKTESWKTWLPVIVALIAFGLFAALWPSLSSGLGSGSSRVAVPRVPFESHPVTLAIPEIPLPNGTTVGGQSFTMEPWQAVLAVTAVTVALVLGVGVVLGFLYVFLNRLVVKTTASDSYKENLASLENKQNAILKEKRAGRPAAPPRADTSMPRWSMVSTGLIVLLFVLFGMMTVVTTFFPERVAEVGGELINPATLMVGIPMLIALTVFVFAPRWGTAALALLIIFFTLPAAFGLLNWANTFFGLELALVAMINLSLLVQVVIQFILVWRWRSTTAVEFSQKVAHADARGREKGIPYDAIAVIFTGLLILGLGIGLMVLINSPYWAQMMGQ